MTPQNTVIPTDQREWSNPKLLFYHPSDLDLHHSQITATTYSAHVTERLYSTYLIASRSRTLYIGVTGDLRRRVFQRKWKEYEGFSAKYNCDRLVWFEHHQEVAKAIARETQLKKWNRSKKISLIERKNPTWQDLSLNWFEYEPADYKRSLDQFEPRLRPKATAGSPAPFGRSECQEF